jgi:hypothetical protein
VEASSLVAMAAEIMREIAAVGAADLAHTRDGDDDGEVGYPSDGKICVGDEVHAGSGASRTLILEGAAHLLPPLHIWVKVVGAWGASMGSMGVGSSNPPAPMLDSPLHAGKECHRVLQVQHLATELVLDCVHQRRSHQQGHSLGWSARWPCPRSPRR